jgi:integrase
LEQQRIERRSPQFLRNIVRIVTETGLRINKELLSMRKDQVDIANATVWIPDSKTENGVADRASGSFPVTGRRANTTNPLRGFGAQHSVKRVFRILGFTIQELTVGI